MKLLNSELSDTKMKYSISFLSVLSNKIIQYNEKQLHDLYLEYFNNFLTIDKFSEYYNLTRYEASKILDIGKKIDSEIFENKEV